MPRRKSEDNTRRVDCKWCDEIRWISYAEYDKYGYDNPYVCGECKEIVDANPKLVNWIAKVVATIAERVAEDAINSHLRSRHGERDY